jgi:hypothetical protein
MKTYFVSAMVEYTDEIDADSEDDARDKFIASCLYDVDESTIEVEAITEELPEDGK